MLCFISGKDFEDIPKARYGRETRVHRTYVKFSTFIEGPSLGKSSIIYFYKMSFDFQFVTEKNCLSIIYLLFIQKL